MTVLIETIGDIVNSPRPGHCLRVVDDVKNSGGFLIYEWWPASDGPNANNSFDTWVEPSRLHEFFRESSWQVRWRNER